MTARLLGHSAFAFAALAAVSMARAQDEPPDPPLILPDLRGAAASPRPGDPPTDLDVPGTTVQPGAGETLIAPGSRQVPAEVDVPGGPEALDAIDASIMPDSPATETSEAADGSPTPDTPAVPNPFFSVGLESLEATRLAPLFTPSRTAPSVEPEPEPEAAPVEAEVAVESEPTPPELKLIGIVRAGSEEVAILSDPSTAEVQRLRPGEEVQGWTLRIVDTQTVELKSGDQSHTLTMFTEYPATGQLPPTMPDPESENVEDWTGEEQNGYGEAPPGEEPSAE